MADTNVGIRFTANVDKLNAGLSKSANVTAKVSGTHAGLQKSLDKTGQSMFNLSKDSNRASDSMLKFGKSADKAMAFAKVGLGVAGLRMLTHAVAGFMGKHTTSAMNAIETNNLFEVSFGKMATSVEKSLVDISNGTGMTLTNLKNVSGTYNLLARSMGFNSQQASVLSTNMTKLGLDLSSLMNIPVEQVMGDLRSGLLGQSETVYKYGIDVTEASIAQEALNLGITRSIRTMSQGEKMYLRQIVILKQTSLAHGDFANTIEQPANQLRILQFRIQTLSETIGKLFIPVLAWILPYANAVVIVITRMIRAIGAFFGIDMNSKDGGADKLREGFEKVTPTIGGVASSLDDVDKAMGSVGKASDKTTKKTKKNAKDTAKEIKKLQSVLLGIDEINLLKQPDENDNPDADGVGDIGNISTPKIPKIGGIGGLGDGGLGGIFGGLPVDAFMNGLENIKTKADELADKIMPIMENILRLAGLIGAVILAWRIVSFVNGLKTAGGLMAKLLPAGVTPMFLGWVAIVAIMILRIVDLIKNNKLFRRGLEAILDGFIWIGKKVNDITTWAGEMMEAFNMSEFAQILEDAGLDVNDLLILLGAGLLLLTPFGVGLGVALLAFEGVTIAIRLLGLAVSPAVESIEEFGAGISDATKAKVEPFITKVNELKGVLSNVYLSGTIIKQSTIDEVKKKLEDLVSMIKTELDADQNEDLAQLKLLKNAMSEEDYNALVASTKKYYKEANKSVTDNEKEILDIMTIAKKNGGKLTEEQNARLLELQTEMEDTGVKHMSETSIEYETIMRKLKDNTVAISAEQGSAIIMKAKETKDKTVADAETQYSKVLLSAQRMLDSGKISKEQYQVMVDAAKKTKDKTIESANTQFDTINTNVRTKLGDTAKYIDEENGTIRSKWDMKWEELAKSADKAFKNIKDTVEKWWNKLAYAMSGIGTGIVIIVQVALNNLISQLETKLNKIIDKVNWIRKNIFGMGEMSPVSFGRIEISSMPVDPYGFEKQIKATGGVQFANGGFPDTGQMFIAREAGNELVGSIGRKSAVVNNDQIVESVSKGVAVAVSAVLGGNRQSGDIVLKVGSSELGRIAINSINNVTKQEGRLLLDV